MLITFLILLFIIVCLISTLVYIKYKVNFRTWDQLQIVNIKPSIPFGNMKELVTEKLHFGVCYKNLYNSLKSACKQQPNFSAENQTGYGGIYIWNQPYLLAIDPEFIKTILVRDFNTFTNRGVYSNPKDDPLSANIFFTENDEWKLARQKLSFAFTSNKMKTMFGTLNEVGNQLVEYILNSELTQHDSCDFKELMAGFTTDVISSCIFGLQGNSLTNPSSEFRINSRKAMKLSSFKMMTIFLATNFPNQAKRLGFRVFEKDTTEFFYNIVQQTIKYRRENQIERKDLMQILIEMMSKDDNEIDEKLNLSLDEIVANAFIFFFAGFETTSTALSVTLYYMALNPEIQENVRAEINSILNKESLSYDNINQMDLLNRVVLESMRIHPPIASLHRSSSKPYTLPNGSLLPQGTPVIIPVLALHHDPEIWQNPECFNPNRFTNEESQKRHSFAYLPFGEGNRICIGQRLALMQIKVGLIKVLRNFRVEISRKTSIPLKVDSFQVSYIPSELLLKVSKLNKDELIGTEL